MAGEAPNRATLVSSGQMSERTKAFALRIIRLYAALPRTTVPQVIGQQVLRSGTAVGANYREGAGARSRAEFVAKLGLVEQELSETEYWLELLAECGQVRASRLQSLINELRELRAMTVASIKTARRHKERPHRQPVRD